MNKLQLIFAAALIALTSFSVFAQKGPSEVVNFSASLSEYVTLKIEEGAAQSFTFNNANEYNNGIESNEDGSHVAKVSVDASTKWKMTLKAANENFTASNNGAEGSLAANNLGYYIKKTGTNAAGTDFVNNTNNPEAPVAVSHIAKEILTSTATAGSSNIGDFNSNQFNINWEMGTQDGDMNPASIFEQMRAGNFTTGTYTLDVSLTVSAID